MGRFKKNPVEIEAVHLGEDGIIEGETPKWFEEARSSGTIFEAPEDDGSLMIVTSEGTMRASLGDWVIKGIKGELYPCKPDIFAATYKEVSNG